MPSIYNYLNYREYLKNFFLEQKQFRNSLTHRAVLNKMGVTSTGFLANVLSGRKNLNKEMSRKLGKIINLATAERRYLNQMVLYTQAKCIEEKKCHLDALLAMRENELSYMSKDQLSIFSRWYYVYIRDLLCFLDFKDDYQMLAAKLDPSLKPDEAKVAIRDLERLGFIARDKDGYFRPVDHLVSTGDETHSVQLANFQLVTMDMAKRSLQKHPGNKRDISFVSLTLSEESFARAKSEVQAFRKRLLLMARDEKKPDRVCQCNIQLFPVTKEQGDVDE